MTRLESKDLLELVFVADPRVAPDGSAVAAVVSRVETVEDKPPRYRSELQLFDHEGNSRSVGPSQFRDERPRFSPAGDRLAFLTRSSEEERAQLAVVPLSGGEHELLTDEAGGVLAFEWQPDSRKLAYLTRKSEADKEEPVARRIDRLSYKLDGKGYLPREPRRLRLLEPGGEPRDLKPSKPGLDIEEFAWSASGDAIYFTSALDQTERDDGLRRLYEIEPATGTTRELLGPGRFSAPSPSPDGRFLALFAPQRDNHPSGPSSVWLLDLELGELTRLECDHDLQPLTGSDARFGEYPNRPQWLDAGELLVNANIGGRSNLATLDASGRLTFLRDEEAVTSAFHHAAGVTAFTMESPARPGELFLLDRSGKTRRLSDFNGALAQRYDFRPASGPFHPREESEAAYWRIDPAEPRDDRALVVEVHGGPHTSVGYGFYFEFQLLAARGYTVIYGNPRGSSSYGFDFATSILGGYGTIDADDVLAFADHALAGHADPSAPVHLTGGSYGGFMTNWLVAHSDRFRSAVTQRSICNFISFYGTSDIGYDFTERELGGNPWEDFDRLWQQSPLRLAHRVNTPLLILHAEDDLRCPVEQAQQWFVAIRRCGLAETKLVLFPGENHELSRSGRADRRVRRLDEIVGWFESHP